MGSVRRLSLGVPGLDRLIGEVEVPYTLLVAGHPGAGKTTLASTVCYANAVQGRRCLYITFYEDREKLFRFMKRLGLDLESAESRGLLRFVRLPQTIDVNAVVGEVNKLLTEGFYVVVVDSVTALLEPVKESAERRAWLLNYFYQLPAVFGGLLILVAELPYGEEKLGLGSVEFVADATILLKHRIEDGFLARLIEVRKARGAPMRVAETYFAIAEGAGLMVFAPPVLADLPPEGRDTILCETAEGAVRFRRGFIVNFFYPPEPGAGIDALIWALAAAARNGMKVLVVSYTRPAPVLREAVERRLAEYGLSGEEISRLIDRHMEIVALNPFAHSLTQLVARELTIIEQRKPDIVLFWGIHLPRGSDGYVAVLKELFNELMYLKSRGITVLRAGPCLDEEVCNAETSISDLTARFVREFREDGSAQTKIYFYERFEEPRMFPSSVVSEFMKRCVEILREYSKKV
jgi:circadian clock protein KaiC